jgi:hypothetical protein
MKLKTKGRRHDDEFAGSPKTRKKQAEYARAYRARRAAEQEQQQQQQLRSLSNVELVLPTGYRVFFVSAAPSNTLQVSNLDTKQSAAVHRTMPASSCRLLMHRALANHKTHDMVSTRQMPSAMPCCLPTVL